jgi:hypothetical protein
LLNDPRVITYERLMDAEELIAQARSRRGESPTRIDAALDVSEPTSSELAVGDDLYLGSLGRYVAALGGHIEVRAVFRDETITVRREPEEPISADPA